LVTGGAGFIGSHLCRRLVSEGSEVITFDNLLTGRVENIESLLGHERFTFENYDVTNYLHVDGDLDAILHFASPASPADFERLPIRPLPPDDPKVRQPDISLAGDVLDGWEPRISVEEGLERTRDYFAEILAGGRSTGA
jgi:nucleoside-diphosphate-sugar epimerase